MEHQETLFQLLSRFSNYLDEEPHRGDLPVFVENPMQPGQPLNFGDIDYRTDPIPHLLLRVERTEAPTPKKATVLSLVKQEQM